jgi:hypothetical protein
MSVCRSRISSLWQCPATPCHSCTLLLAHHHIVRIICSQHICSGIQCESLQAVKACGAQPCSSTVQGQPFFHQIGAVLRDQATRRNTVLSTAATMQQAVLTAVASINTGSSGSIAAGAAALSTLPLVPAGRPTAAAAPVQPRDPVAFGPALRDECSDMSSVESLLKQDSQSTHQAAQQTVAVRPRQVDNCWQLTLQ